MNTAEKVIAANRQSKRFNKITATKLNSKITGIIENSE
jgi:hypothetical protein